MIKRLNYLSTLGVYVTNYNTQVNFPKESFFW